MQDHEDDLVVPQVGDGGGYVFVFDDSRGVCDHCIKLGGFADPLYCWYNHAGNFALPGTYHGSVVAHDPTLPGVHLPEWEGKMYAELERIEAKCS